MFRFGAAALFLGQLSALVAQTPLSFEAASLKLAPPPGEGSGFMEMRGGPGTNDPTRIRYSAVSLLELLKLAYNVEFDQLAGPDWLSTTRYALTANIPPGATQEQFRVMLQNLLKERLRLNLHREARDLTVYDVVLAKGGAKLKESTEQIAPPNTPVDRVLEPDQNGFPQVAPGRRGYASRPDNGTVRATYRCVSIDDFTRGLGREFDGDAGGGPKLARFVNKTGLNARYDFHLEYAGTNQTSGAPSLTVAIERQLGLKLVKSTAKVEVVVVDAGERVPVEN